MGGKARYTIDPPEENPKAIKLTVKLFDISVSFESPHEITHFEFCCRDSDDLEYYEYQFYSPGLTYYDGRNLPEDSVAELRAKNHEVISSDLKIVRSFSSNTLYRIGRFVAGIVDS